MVVFTRMMRVVKMMMMMMVMRMVMRLWMMMGAMQVAPGGSACLTLGRRSQAPPPPLNR